MLCCNKCHFNIISFLLYVAYIDAKSSIILNINSRHLHKILLGLTTSLANSQPIKMSDEFNNVILPISASSLQNIAAQHG